MASERRAFARNLRRRPKFRRQVPFDRFVVDFYCHAGKLAVDPRTAIRGTASSTGGFPTMAPGGRRFWNGSASE